MKPRDIQVRLTSPCSQSIDNMSESRVGYYCHSCEKDVIDFTSLSDATLRRVLDELKGKPMCGMFRADQLNRPLPAPPAKPLWQRAVGRLAASYILLQSLVHTAVAQTTKLKAITQQQATPAATDSLVLKGIVIDAYSQLPAYSVHLLIRKHNIKATTDSKGWFELKIPADVIDPTFIIETNLEAQTDGFIIDDIKVNRAEYIAGKQIVLYRYIGAELPKQECLKNAKWRTEVFHTGGAIISSVSYRPHVTTIYMWKVWAFFAKPFKRKHHAH